MSEEIEFDLSTPIKFESGGVQTEGIKILLSAPTNKIRQHRNALKDYITLASNYAQKAVLEIVDLGNEDVLKTVMEASQAYNEGKSKGKEKTPEDLDALGKEIMDQIFNCPDIKTNAVVEEFILLAKETCMLEGEKPLCKNLFAKMTCSDTDKLMAKYFGNFINGY